MKCKNCGYDLNENVNFCPYCGNKIEIIKDKKSIDSSKYKIYSIVSLVLALLPVLLYIACYMYSNGDASESGNGAVFWLLILYFWTIGFPIAITSVVLGVISFKYKKSFVSILGIIIGSLTILLFGYFFIGTYN